MQKRLAVAVALCGAMLLAVLIGWVVLSRPSVPTPEPIPEVAEVDSITARLPDLKESLGLPPVPEFKIPRDCVPIILNLLTSAEPDKNPPRPEHVWSVAHLTIATKAGKKLTVDIHSEGQNPLCFSLNGVRCRRGGDYFPLRVEANYEMGVDEGNVLVYMLWAMHQEEAKGKKSETLDHYLRLLEKSTGRKLVRPNSQSKVP
jgi:hypothetical protein